MSVYYKEKNGKLFQGDCLEIMKKLPTACFDMILCDLPYGTTACKWDIEISIEQLWPEYIRLIKPNCAVVLTATQPFSSVLISKHLKGYKHNWYWIKEKGTNFATAKYCPLRLVEEINVFTSNGEKVNYFPIMEKLDKPYKHVHRKKTDNDASHMNSKGLTENGERAYKTYTHKFPTNVLYFNRPNQNKGAKGHPTQKPVALFEYLIKTYTNEGNIVLDNCIGSGTTAIACKNLNRKWVGIEKEEKYCEIAKNRLLSHEPTKN